MDSAGQPTCICAAFVVRWQLNGALKTMRLGILRFAVIKGLFLTILGVAADSTARQWTASVRWENDTFGGTDRFYTDGISISLAHTGSSWIDPLADKVVPEGTRRTVAYDLGQIMTTPSDTKRPVPDPADRPYAGLLWAGISLHIERDDTYNGVKFITGVVGPWSLAEETQREVHRLIGSGVPRGWDYQLHNEPILNLVYEHRRRYMIAGDLDGFGLQALPMGNLMLGNVLTQAQIGSQLRFGWRIPDDFGTTLMRGMVHLPPPRRDPAKSHGARWGVSVYGGVSVNLVGRNITLDGNTWRDSPSVDKEWFVPAAEVGITVGCRKFLTGFSYVFWGKEFKGQDDYFEFGAITFMWFF